MSRRHYLDHASTSPLRPEARDAVVAVLDAGVGDPARIHEEGMAARVLVEEAREQVAALVGARSREVVFTSGATESIATAVWGASRQGGSHQVVPAVEHSAVREQAARAGEVTVVGVDRLGRVDPDEVIAAIRPGETSLVHVQWGNHEVGTRQPVAEVVTACRERGVLVHVDAAQGVGHDPVAFDELGADLMSVSAHKFGGPAGVGALLVRRGLRLDPLLLGGDQERARRAGHESTAAVVGFGAAASALLRDDLLGVESTSNRRQVGAIVAAAEAMDGIEVYGDPVDRLPHIVCLGVHGVEPQPVLIGLDRAGIAVHSGSSCASEDLLPSPVLEAMGVDAQRSLRVSVGWSTTDDDVDALLDALPRVVADLRRLASG
ncbi:cysteine desulfurase family protein [Actinomarinicola tropica]|uniref:Aminotransferase class V-fold PLP-dependent enzyme n=1 Tax=Actinomarinicola tropica TaxID=2789776 RepID=A0A5Q2RIZ0_9ACTN|nr:cysteine desulfurase family protein [Actinomarinicola tropica]QGG94541.1 aminotransferase class V-fold PLP-dependent enzyme [Actinomarinicola tropica]